MKPSIRRLEPPFQLPPPISTSSKGVLPSSSSSSIQQHPAGFLPSSPLASSFPSLQPPSQSNSLTPTDPMDLPLPSPSFREGHGHHASTSTSASSFNSSALDSPSMGAGNHRTRSGIDTPPSSTMGSPPTDFPAAGGARGWGGNGAVMGSREEKEGEDEEEAGRERDVPEQQHHHHTTHSYDSHHRYAGSSRSDRSDSIFNSDDRANMTTPDFISSFDPDPSSSKPWTSVFGGPVASTSTSSAPPSFSPAPNTQDHQSQVSSSSTASSSRTRDTASSTSSLPPSSTRGPPPSRPSPSTGPTHPASLVPLTMVHDQGSVYVETTSAEAARAYKKQLDKKEGVEGGNSSKRSPFVIESGSKGGKPIFMIRRRSNSAVDPVLLRALSPINTPSTSSSFSPPPSGLTSPRSPTGPVSFLPLARPSSPNNSSTSTQPRSPTTTVPVKPKGRLLRLSQSMQSMGAAYGGGKHKVVEPVVPGNGKLGFPEANIVRHFFGPSDRPLSSVPSTLNNPLISITSSSPSPRRRQSALTLQTFPSSSLGSGSTLPTSPPRTRISSRPVRLDPPMSPTQRIRLLSQQLFKPGERPSVDENVNAPLKPKSSSASLRGLFLRKIGSVPALRGMQSFESGGSGETARPEGSSERDSLKTTTRRPHRDSAHGRLSSEYHDQDVTPRAEETVVLLGPVPVAAKERSSGEGAPKVSFPMQAPPAASPKMEEQTFTTQIFDVFQEYRGDPNADLESVAPGDDPRFVVWKVSVLPQSQPISKRAGAAPSSTSSSSNPSPINLTPGNPLPTPPSSSSLVKTTRTLEAATIERWVAQITFNFNLEVWLDFFLVYRAYISPLSLCRLLMARFEWGCRTQESDGVDLRGAKQLAASRACYVLRVWLNGFFEVDWLNDKEMRLEFTSWLNRLSAEKKGFDKLSRNTLSKLRKIIRELKHKYDTPAYKPLLGSFGSSPPTPLPDDAFSASSFATAQAVNRLVLHQTPPLQQQQQNYATLRNGPSSNRSGSSSSNSFSPQNNASLMSLPSSFGRSKIPKFFRSIGRGTFGSNRPMLGGNSFELGGNDEEDFLSRKGGVSVLLSSLQISSPPASDFESSAASASEEFHGDTTGSSSDTSGRFVVAGLGIAGVEGVVVDLDVEARRPSYQSPSLDSVVEERPSHEMERPPAVVPEVAIPLISPAEEQTATFPSEDLTTPPRRPRSLIVAERYVEEASDPVLGSPAPIRQPLFAFTRDVSPGASSDIQNAIIPFHTLDIDDADFSSSDDDSFHQPVRRLPAGGPQLQLVRRSIDTLSSYVQAPRRGSTHSTSSAGSNRGSEPHPFNYELLKEFRVDELESDEDDDGGAEGALLRLEGKFDPEKQKAKNAKVEFLVQQAISKSRQRSGSNDASMDPTGARRGGGSDEDGTGFGGRESLIEFDVPATSQPPTNPASTPQMSSFESETRKSITRVESVKSDEPDMDLLVDTLNATPSSRPLTLEQSSSPPLPSNDTTPNLLSTPRPTVETNLPPSSYVAPPVLGRRTPTTPSKRNSLKKRRPSNAAPPSIPKALAPKHVCFIFKFKTDLLAIHLANIDAQLMNGISFVELGSLPPPWLTNAAPQLDSWEALLSERTSRKVHGRPKISDASMWVRRFEMMSRWVESEIILTPRVQRTALISRFVKLAQKTYQLSDFLSTVAIISGLQTPFVKLSLGEKAWSKVSLLQELNYLRNLTSPDGGYANLRREHSAVADQHVELFEGDAWSVPAHGGTAAASSTSASARSSVGVGNDESAEQFYIPFMGIYLQDLEAIDRASEFSTPQVPADLPPLPEGVVPGPLINVAKARQRAKILREVVVFNTLASKYPTDVDGGVYRLCLKLSALPISSVERLANDLRSL